MREAEALGGGEESLLTLDRVREVVRGVSSHGGESGGGRWRCPASKLLEAARLLQEGGARLLTMSTLPHTDGERVLTYTFELVRGGDLVVRVFTEAQSVSSLFSCFPAADFLEREVNHLFGVKFLGHPNLPQPARGEKGPLP